MATVCGVLGEFSLIVRVAFWEPTAVGFRLSEMVQELLRPEPYPGTVRGDSGQVVPAVLMVYCEGNPVMEEMVSGVVW